MTKFDLTYISCGVGIQSCAMTGMSDRGEFDVPRADVAIFADTGDEPQWVYDNLERLRKAVNIPIEVVTNKVGRASGKGLLYDAVLRNDKLNREGRSFAPIPMFTQGDDGRAMLRRQCTREYKIDPIEKYVRQLLGVEPGRPVRGLRAQALIGISLDEVQRMKPNRRPWIKNAWPLAMARLRREDCRRWCIDTLGFEPKRSSCVYCPYHSDAYWRDLHDNYPDEFERACRADEQLRNQTMNGSERPAYLHRSLQPLREVVFDGDGQSTLWDMFTEECEGMCGV